MRTRACRLLTGWALLLVLTSSAVAADEKQAEQLRAARKYEEARAAYQGLLADKNLPPEQQVRYQWAIFDCFRQQKKNAEALATVEKILSLIAEDDPGVWSAQYARFELLNQLNRREEAATFAAQRAAASGGDPERAFGWYWGSGLTWSSIKRYDQAVAIWKQMAELAAKTSNNRRLSESLWRTAEEYWAAGTPDKCLEPLKQLVNLKSEPETAPNISAGRQRLAECYARLNRPAEARDAYASFIPTESTASGRQRWWLAMARAWQTEKNNKAALEAAENTISAQAGMPGYDRWFEAQSLIADLAAQAGDMDAALQASRVCLDVADSRERVVQSAGRIVALLRQIDKKPDRAKAFQDFQASGTPPDPLSSVAGGANPVREAAFAKAEAALGTDSDALMQRGLMQAYLGRKKEACTLLAEACRRAAGDDVAPAYTMLLFVGVRGLQGNVAGLENAARYFAEGTAGADPLAGLPPVKIELSPQRLAMLTELRRKLETIVADTPWPEGGRRDAILALQRVHSALGDWNDPAVLQWYVASTESEKDNMAQELLVPGLLAAARGGEIHWGKAREFATTQGPLLAKLQKFVDPAAKQPRSPFFALQKLQEQSRAAGMFKK